MSIMKKNIFCKTIIFFVLALAFSCSQDPIFFTISTETKPVKPRIPGGPTNMVVFDNRMYVASGRLFSYNSASGWDDGMQPGGKVIGLAATDEHLYALCIIGTGVTTVLQRKGRTGGWAEIKNPESQYTLVQSIYAVNSEARPYLFAGARNNSGINYGILCLDDTSPDPALRLIVGDTEILSGAASRREKDLVYFLSTKGRGVYMISETDLSVNTPATQLGGSENRLLMGMTQLYKDEENNGPIIVIERDNGTFFEVRESGFRELRNPNGTVSSGKFATGALAEWQQVTPNDDNDGIKMLIAGIQGSLFSTSSSSSYSHGYVEIELDTVLTFDDGWLVLSSSRGINPDITVDGNTDRYTATIGKHPVNHFFQAPESVDSNRTFFASTQTAGLWSYRIREGGPQWNAEN